MPRLKHKFWNRSDSNWAPLSEMIVVGTPYRDIQCETSVFATMFAEIDLSGTTSNHLVFRSSIVSRYE